MSESFIYLFFINFINLFSFIRHGILFYFYLLLFIFIYYRYVLIYLYLRYLLFLLLYFYFILFVHNLFIYYHKVWRLLCSYNA